MLVIAGIVKVRPELRAEAVKEALEMARATQAEAGCKAYRFSADLEDPNTFLLFEEWENEEALARHFQSAHMAKFNAAAPRLMGGAPSFNRYDVSAKVKMM